MANPSPAALSAIRGRVSDWSASDPEVAAALNAPDPAYPNPGPRPDIPRPFGLADVVNAVDPARRMAIKPYLAVITPLVIAQDRGRILAGFDAAVAIGDAQQSDRDAVAAVLAGTTPDPAWRADLSWAEATLGRPADLADVAAARAAGGN
jgi:hypothetical protein